MKWTITVTALLLLFGLNGSSMAQSTPCPDGMVCVSPAVARKALEDADKVIALEVESKAKDQAIADLRDLLNKARIEFANVSGENTALKQNAVQDRAVIGVLLTKVQKKCILAFCL